jgi:hypothetical protein
MLTDLGGRDDAHKGGYIACLLLSLRSRDDDLDLHQLLEIPCQSIDCVLRRWRRGRLLGNRKARGNQEASDQEGAR